MCDGEGGGKGETYAQAGGEHAGCYDEVGEDETGHAEGKEHWLARVCVILELDTFLDAKCEERATHQGVWSSR